ncbi:MAG: undecaprenyl-diphosphate phosphatase [Planctomycetales bacterium]|nr:undecaprenyl-diphosphate phosphatase [Planctomycetales bacterium]
MHLIDLIILGIVQGLTEFLPVSSSGHLVIVAALFEACYGRQLPDVVEVNILLHLGTLVSTLTVYWSRVWRMLGDDRRLAGWIVLATLPAVVVGLLMKRYFEGALENPLLAGCLLIVTGVVLLLASRLPVGEWTERNMGAGRAWKIGLSQAIAVLPGISRSGITISAGLAVGLRRDAAATFSFLLMLPAVAGACTLETLEFVTSDAPVHTSWTYLLTGMFVSFLVGVFALRWLLNWLRHGRLHYFAYWCIPLGLGVIVWQLVG